MYFEVDNYRSAIAAKIKSKGLTHEKFIKEHPDVLTVSSFSAFMSGHRRLSLQTFFSLARSALRAKPEEAFYLYLLGLENDLDLNQEGNIELKTYLSAMRLKLLPFLRGDFRERKAIREESILFNDFYEMLDSEERIGVLKFMEREIRKKNALLKDEKPGKALLSKIKRLLGPA